MKRWLIRVFVLLFLAAAAFGAATWYSERGQGQGPMYRTAMVQRGDLVATIPATGTLQPEESINIGAQVAGQIISFGKDVNGKSIDYRSEVTQGMVLAQIDDSLYRSDLSAADAQLKQSEAGVLRANADLVQLKAKLYQAERDWARAEKLGPSEALAETLFDSYKAAYESAKAAVAVGEAQIVQAQSSVVQAEASVSRAKRNLDYCVIKSPVDGVIIDRRVNIGQTVVSSLNAPSLFLIAKDLRRMQVWVAVNEVDIGLVREGVPVTFTVDAFRDREFKGQVSRVRWNAAMTQNVVNYTVEVTADNSDGILLPYLTANVRFEVGRAEGALLVPSAALRFTPQPSQIAPEEGRPATRPASSGPMATVWVRQGQFLRPIAVRTGLSDDGNAMTVIEGEDVREGMEVVVGEQYEDAAESGGATPFMPQFRRGGRGGGSGGGGRGGRG